MMKQTSRKAIAILAASVFALLATALPVSAGQPVPATLPRNETLYFGGQQYGPISTFNPFHPVPNNWLIATTTNVGIPRLLLYETLFAINTLDGTLNPILGKEFSMEGRNLTVKMKPEAHWSDGKPVTAHDVAFTFYLAQKYTTTITQYWEYLESVTATDDQTVVFTGKEDNFAPPMMRVMISGVFITPKHVWEKVDAEAAGDNGKFLQFGAKDLELVSSGPYRFLFADETKSIVVRDDNYWGQSPAMWGKLPAPKYIAHNVFKDNNASMAAFRDGQIDVNQQFMPRIWRLWENDGLPVSTYIDEPPYYLPGKIPSLWFNLSKPGLDDFAVRKALAIAINYDMVAQNAMSGYSPPIFQALLLPTPPMMKLIDAEALKPYQWTGNQVDEANKMLDDAGWVKGSDGIRAKDGVRLSFRLECPTGWTDWTATLEIVAQAGRQIGMELTTYFREAPVYTSALQAGQTDIGLWNIEAINAAAPWGAARYALSSIGVPPIGQAATFNYSRFKDDRADELISLLATETDEAKVKAMWTELNIIYLKNLPCIPVMYRPLLFHEVNESVWTNFPKMNDGRNIPPIVLTDAMAVKGLYEIRNK